MNTRKFTEDVYAEMRTFGFPRKGAGRIYVQTQAAIQQVKDLILEIDENEFDYLPDDFITTADHYPQLVYVGKFDELPIEALTAKCWAAGVPIWCVCDGKGVA